MAQPNASDLCLSCGLCCDGTLFRTADAGPDEAERLGAVGMAVFESGEGLRFRQPCPQLLGGRCGIYAARPSVCSTYRCRLLRRLEAGDVGPDDARRTVAKARELVGRLAVELATQEARAHLFEAGAPGELRAARVYLDAVALDMYLTRHFRSKEDDQRRA